MCYLDNLQRNQVDTREDNAISVVYVAYEVPKVLKFPVCELFQYFFD